MKLKTMQAFGIACFLAIGLGLAVVITNVHARTKPLAEKVIGQDEYFCDVKRVIDGDTYVVDIHLGLDVVLVNQHIRAADINAPETRTRDPEEKKRGLEAKEKLRKAIEGKRIVVEIKKRGKYGRWLGVIK